MPSTRPKWKAYAALICGTLIIGLSAIFTRLAEAPGSIVSLYRMAIVTLAFAVPFAASRRHKPALPRRGIGIAALAGIFLAIDLAAWSSGVAYGGATIPTLLGNAAPLWVGLGALFIFRERLKPTFWLGLLLAMAGALVVLGIDLQAHIDLNLGGMLGLIGSFFYGGYMLTAQRGRDQLDTLSFFWLTAAVASVLLLLICLALQIPLFGYSQKTYLYLLVLGLLVQGGGWMALTYAQGHLPASMVSPTLLTQPLITAIIAGPLLGEWLTRREWLGAMAVLLGVVIVHRSRAAAPSPSVTAERH